MPASFIVASAQRAATHFLRMGKFFYAVQKGWKTGVFETWAECQSNVNKFPNARFKKFPTFEEAVSFVEELSSSVNNVSQTVQNMKVLQPKATNIVNQPTVVQSSTSDGIASSSSGADVMYHCPCCPVGQALKISAAAKRALDDDEEELLAKRRKSSAYGNQRRNFTSSSKHNSADDSRAIVYTDGACIHNGRRGARAGIGVHWIDKSSKDLSERLKGKQTNQRAELTAAIKAIETAKKKGIEKLKLHTDSKYTINCATEWVKKWKRNGWKTANGQEVLNKDDVVQLDHLCDLVDVQWIYVPGHSNIPGNEMADKLARKGALLPS